MESARLRAMRKEAAVARAEADLREQGVIIHKPEPEVAPSEQYDDGLEILKATVLEEAQKLADQAARALIEEEEAEAAARKATKLALDEAKRLAAHKKALLLAEKQRVAEEKRVLAEQQRLQAAEAKRQSRAERRAAREKRAEILDVTINAPAPAAPAAPTKIEESRFAKLFAVVEQQRHIAFSASYRLFMSRFGLVPTHSPRGEVLVVGELDNAGNLVACSEEQRCVRCFEKRMTHMYVPCGHLCVCRDCALGTDGVLSCPGCEIQPTSVLFVHGHESVTR